MSAANAPPADAAEVKPATADDLRAAAAIIQSVIPDSTIAARLRALAVEMDHRPHQRWVRVADQLVAELSAEWSEPVRVKITNDDGRELQLVFKSELR